MKIFGGHAIICYIIVTLGVVERMQEIYAENVIKWVKRVTIATYVLMVFVMCIFSGSNQVYGEYQYVVFIHAGHGGSHNIYDKDGKLLVASDPGAEVKGVYEKDLNLAVAQKLAKQLEEYSPKIKVVMARDDDTYYNFAKVPADAEKAKATVVVSIHHNYFKKSGISGTETYYYNSKSADLAYSVQKHLIARLGLVDRGVKQYDYTTISSPNIPSVLAEIGFMTNPYDFSVITNPEYQEWEAEAIQEAILETLEL